MMKRLTFFLMIFALAISQTWAAPVNAASARSIAQNFLTNDNGNGTGCNTQTVPTSGSSDVPLLHAERSSTNWLYNAYYIFGNSNGFVIVAGDDRAGQILGYGSHEIDMNNIPCGMQFLLDMYKEQIDYLLQHPGVAVQTPSYNVPKPTTSVSPLLNAHWDQREPYWNQCNFDGTQCLTGCSCTALCQVMYYWQYPSVVSDSIQGYKTKSLGIDVPALPPTTFDWANMIDSYSGNYSTAQGDAVATLMRYVGQAEGMNYCDNSTADEDHIKIAAQKFGYSNARVLLQINYKAKWDSIIQAELRAHRPIVYVGYGNGMAHAFNIDGYEAPTNKYHINFGWSGSGDGYYLLNAITPTDDYDFSYRQRMVVGLESPEGIPTPPTPTPIITVTPAEFSFVALTGQMVTKAIKITGNLLSGDLTLTLNDEAGIYSIDRNHITADEAAAGTNVIVTYNPTEVGSSTASVIISGGGAESKTVTLSGEASENPVINVDVSKVTFGPTYTGYESSTVITITGPVSENIELSWQKNQGGFGLSNYTITPQEAAVGAKVTVYFNPTWSSAIRNTLEIKSVGTETVSIPVSGTKIKSDGYIVASPSNLSFETEVGEQVIKTFRLYYSKSNGNDAIMMSNVNNNDDSGTGNNGYGCGNLLKMHTMRMDSLLDRSKFKIDSLKLVPNPVIGPIYLNGLNLNISGDNGFTVSPGHVSLEDAQCGYYVTVTYNPESVGIHEAIITITLSGGTAKPMTVKLHGTATESKNNAPRGDINNTGTVDITDVTELINVLLNATDAPDRADVNDDKQVNISDVTNLIDLLTNEKTK